MGARIEVERIARNDRQPSRIARRDLFECRNGAVVTLDRYDSLRALREQCAGEPARTGTDLDHVHAFERTGRACDPSGEIEIEQEILAERLLGPEVVAADHLAQWRKVVYGAHEGAYARLRGLRPRRASGRKSVPAESRAASWSAAIKLPGSARPLPAMSKAVP